MLTAGSVYQPFHTLQPLYCVSQAVKRAAQVVDAVLGWAFFTENLLKACLVVCVLVCQNAGVRADTRGAEPEARLIEHY